jgi:hypothetical protein
MTTTKDIAVAFVNSRHGWAVSEQLESIYDDLSEENLVEQNHNALRYIRDSLTSLIESKALSEGSKEELTEVLLGLVQHLQWNS